MTGGFWDSHAARASGQGRQHAMSAGMAELALLSTRHVKEAELAAGFIARILSLQPAGEAGVFFAVNRQGGETILRKERTAIDYLDPHGAKQRPGRLGPILVLLARLHRLTGDPACLAAARRWSAAMLASDESAYLCVEGHKFVWGVTELKAIDGGTDSERRDSALARIVPYILGRQRPDGQWHVDAGVTDANAEQPLFWRIDTTCNVLVGLMSYAWAR